MSPRSVDGAYDRRLCFFWHESSAVQIHNWTTANLKVRASNRHIFVLDKVLDVRYIHLMTVIIALCPSTETLPGILLNSSILTLKQSVLCESSIWQWCTALCLSWDARQDSLADNLDTGLCRRTLHEEHRYVWIRISINFQLRGSQTSCIPTSLWDSYWKQRLIGRSAIFTGMRDIRLLGMTKGLVS